MKFEKGKIYRAAMYIRLSKEDGDKVESNSVTNQRDLIYNYLKNNKEIILVSEKVDDGYSGVSFERPALMEMLQDVQDGKIDCIITKDLSRFGRNYIETGRYIEEIFPTLGVRFIAINDGVDTAKQQSISDSILLPFKNLMNDAYARDISIKTRTGLSVRQKRGDFIGSFPVYGYMRSPEQKGKLIIDETVADVIKKIFAMRIAGHNNDSIANYLNNTGVLSPLAYKESLNSNYKTVFKVNAHTEWNHVAVGRILTNEMYTGVMVQGKETTYNYKFKERIKVPKEDWIRVENMHEAIISKADFEIVQSVLQKDTRTAPNKEQVYLFSGFVKCADCGGNLVRKVVKNNGKSYPYLICSTYKRDNKKCKSHLINEGTLENIVFEMLKKHIELLCNLEELLEEIKHLPLSQSDIQKCNKHLVSKREQLTRYNSLKVSVYEDYTDGILSKAEYIDLRDNYENLANQTEESINFLEQELASLIDNRYTHSEWIERFKEHKNITSLTRTTLTLTIDNIIIYQNKRVKINFKFKNEFECSIKLLQAVTNNNELEGISSVVNNLIDGGDVLGS